MLELVCTCMAYFVGRKNYLLCTDSTVICKWLGNCTYAVCACLSCWRYGRSLFFISVNLLS